MCAAAGHPVQGKSQFRHYFSFALSALTQVGGVGAYKGGDLIRGPSSNLKLV